MRALIIGLESFTGQHLTEELEEHGVDVFGTTHAADASSSKTYSVDILDSEQLQRIVSDVRPDWVVHLAAVTFVQHGDADELYRTNIVGTRNLLQALTKTPKRPSAVLVASSANIYGNGAEGTIDESREPCPANDYGVSKLAVEHVCRLWSDQLPIIISRPFNYTGVGQTDKFLIPKIVRHFREGKKEIELGNLDVYRDFSDVRDVVAIYRRLLESGAGGKTVNVCSGTSHSLQSLLDMMAGISGHPIHVKVNPDFVRANEIKVLQGDDTRLKNVIGEIERIPLQDTLRWMYATEERHF